MNIVLIVFFAILIAAAFAGVGYLGYELQHKDKWWIVALAAVCAVVGEALFVAAACIPSKATQLLADSFERTEMSINTLLPGQTNKVMTTNEIKTILSDTKATTGYIKENEAIGWVSRTVGVSVYVDVIDNFLDSSEQSIRYFEENNIPFTIHNIFEKLQRDAQGYILGAAKVLEIVVLVVALLVAVALLVFYLLVKKGALDAPAVVFGDEAEGER